MNRESERRPCPVCNQRDAEEFWGKEALQLVRCRCAMVFADPVAEEFASGAFYHERRFYLSASKLKSDYAPVRFERELRLFRAWCPAGAVLDVGCSTGAFLHTVIVWTLIAALVTIVLTLGPTLALATCV